MEKQRLSMPMPRLIKLLACAAIYLIFWFLPPVAPLTQVGMRVIGTFITVVLTLSLVDTVWPAMLACVLLSLSGVCTLNAAIAGTLGGWIIYLILMSFLLTHALTEVGFIDRVVGKFMGLKAVNRTPWTFTLSLGVLGFILGAFLDQVAATAFMLAFCPRVYRELGYEKGSSYTHIANIIAIYGVIIGGTSTPISHSLALLGMGIYSSATVNTISMFDYMAFGLPTALVLFVAMCIIFRLFTRPDMSKFADFKIENVIGKREKMDLREKITVAVFGITVLLWIVPSILTMISSAAWITKLNSYGIVFWAIVAVAVLSIVCVNDKPLLDVKDVVNHKTNWGILFFVAIGIYLGSAMSAESTGIVAAITQGISPLTERLPTSLVVLLLAAAGVVMTNFASNVSTITVMTTVGVAVAMATTGFNPAGMALVTTMCGSCAYLLPSSFAPIAMLHGDSYSSSKKIYPLAVAMIILSSIVIAFVGYPIGCALTGG